MTAVVVRHPSAHPLAPVVAALRACADYLETIGPPAPVAPAPAPGDDANLSIADAARRLGVSRGTVYALIKRRELTAQHVAPRSVRIRARDLESFRRRRTR